MVRFAAHTSHRRRACARLIQADATLRLARSADVDAIEPLVALTGVPLDPYAAEALRAETMARALRTGLRYGHQELMRDIATAVSQINGDLRPLYLRSALPLVAEHDQRGIVGTLLAYLR